MSAPAHRVKMAASVLMAGLTTRASVSQGTRVRLHSSHSYASYSQQICARSL